MNSKSECTDKYKQSGIRSYTRRAIVNYSTWQPFHNEMTHLRQMLINNEFSNTEFDNVDNRVMNQYIERNSAINQQQAITVFYANQYTSAYKKDEKIIKDITTQNCTSKSSNKIQYLLQEPYKRL